MTTRVGDERHGRLHALSGDQPSPVTWMAGLPTALPSTLRATTSFALASGQSVGGRRLRGRCRVLLPQRQLVFQVGNLLVLFRDLLRPLGQLPITFSNLALQPTILALQPRARCFRALGALAPLGSRAASLILVMSRGHTTVMADSDKKYKSKMLDQRKRATPPLNCYIDCDKPITTTLAAYRLNLTAPPRPPPVSFRYPYGAAASSAVREPHVRRAPSLHRLPEADTDDLAVHPRERSSG